jgi:hypothetical protein
MFIVVSRTYLLSTDKFSMLNINVRGNQRGRFRNDALLARNRQQQFWMSISLLPVIVGGPLIMFIIYTSSTLSRLVIKESTHPSISRPTKHVVLAIPMKVKRIHTHYAFTSFLQ